MCQLDSGDGRISDFRFVEDLDAAFRTDRRPWSSLANLVLGVQAVIGPTSLGTWLAPRHGLRMKGWTLTGQGLVRLLTGLRGYQWVAGCKLGHFWTTGRTSCFPSSPSLAACR